MPIFRHHRCAHSRSRWGWQAWPCRAHPNIPLPVLPCSIHCPAPYPFIPLENSLSCRVAMVLTARACGLDPSAAGRVFGYRQATITNWLPRAARARSGSAQALFLQPPLPSLAASTNCAQGYAATRRCCGCGWPSTPSRRVFLSSIWVHVRKTPRTWSSTPCDRSWPPFCMPLFTSDGLNVYFYASFSSFWSVA
jgi:hypothetical protein